MFQTTNQFIIHLPHFFPDILGGSTTNYPKFTIKNPPILGGSTNVGAESMAPRWRCSCSPESGPRAVSPREALGTPSAPWQPGMGPSEVLCLLVNKKTTEIITNIGSKFC
jgi:hypothetical protein